MTFKTQTKQRPRFFYIHQVEWYIPLQFSCHGLPYWSSDIYEVHANDCVSNANICYPSLCVPGIWLRYWFLSILLELLGNYCPLCRTSIRFCLDQLDYPALSLIRLLPHSTQPFLSKAAARSFLSSLSIFAIHYCHLHVHSCD